MMKKASLFPNLAGRQELVGCGGEKSVAGFSREVAARVRLPAGERQPHSLIEVGAAEICL
jgi:hypothetical protein